LEVVHTFVEKYAAFETTVAQLKATVAMRPPDKFASSPSIPSTARDANGRQKIFLSQLIYKNPLIRIFSGLAYIAYRQLTQNNNRNLRLFQIELGFKSISPFPLAAVRLVRNTR